MAYESEALDVAEANAVQIAFTQNKITGERVFTRGWKAPNQVRKGTVEDYLNTITSVTAPKFDSGKVRAGAWDVVTSGWDNQFGGYTQTLRQATGYDDGVAGNGTTVSEDLYEKTEQKEYFDQSAVPTVTPYAVGVLKVISAAINQFKRWRVSLKTATSKPYSIDFGVAVQTGYIEHHYIRRNQTTLSLPAITSGYINDYVGNPSQNPDGTWNWYLVVKPLDTYITAGTSYSRVRTEYRYRQLKTTNDNSFWIGGSGGGWAPAGTMAYQRQTVTTTVTYQAFSTAAAAWAYNAAPPTKVTFGVWMAAKTEVSYGLWDWDPYST